MTRSFEALLEAIYDCTEEHRGFEDPLRAIADDLGAQKAHMLVLAGPDVVENTVCRDDEASNEIYRAHWQARDPRLELAASHSGQVLSDVDHIDSRGFERSAIYNDFLAGIDVRYSLVVHVEAGPGLVLAQAFLREKGAGAFGPPEVAQLTRLLPHLRRATRLRELLRAARDERDDLAHALDMMPSAVAILDERGSVLCANAAARQLFAERGGVRTERGVLGAARSSEARELAAAIARAAAFAATPSLTEHGEPPAHVAIQRDGRAPLSVVFLPVRPMNRLRASHAPAGRVLAVFHDPTCVVRLDPELVGRAHDLTATEAALAVALAEGSTLLAFAMARGCSEQTARTHLKHVLDKTGTHRQAELVRVLLTGAAALQMG